MSATGKFVKELEFMIWIDDDQSIRFGRLAMRSSLRCLVHAALIEIGKPGSAHSAARYGAIAGADFFTTEVWTGGHDALDCVFEHCGAEARHITR